MRKLKTNYQAKVRQLKRDTQRRVKEHRKAVRLEEMRKQKRQKDEKKEVFRKMTKEEAKTAKRRRN